MDFDARVLAHIGQVAAGAAAPRRKLEHMLRYLAKWRAHLIQNTIIRETGVVVQGGPFAGMQFVERSSEGCHVPKLLGCYEQELHPYLTSLSERGYDAILNIGAAEGYYAIGLARLFPNARVHAYDTNADSHPVCRELAARNGVSDRVDVGSTFAGQDFAGFDGLRTLVFCDIEGAERDLLDPVEYPSLRNMDIIVELHELFEDGVSSEVADRFRDSHDVDLVAHGGRDIKLPSCCDHWGHLDQLLAIWEWRSGPTPWAVMIARS